MVGEGVASLAATPEPRVRAFPARGSSGYGPLSQTPCAVNDVVTVFVHQAQIVEGVVAVVLVVMVHLYHVLCREAQPAECATTTLSFEQPRDPSRFVRATPQPG